MVYLGSCEVFSFGLIQGIDFCYGWLCIENIFGLEIEILRVLLVIEYYDSGNWMINVQDSCIVLSLLQSSGQVLIVSVFEGNDEQDIISYFFGISSIGVLFVGKSLDFMINLGFVMQNGVVLCGVVRIILEFVVMGVDWVGYFNIDWDGDGDIDIDDKLSGEVFFGIYCGNDCIIYIWEGY